MVLADLKKYFGAQDMTNGVIWRKIAAFSIPLLLGNVMQQLYNTVDSIVVGRFVGDDAIAAVGASFPIMFMLSILFMGIATGTSIMVSQFFGAKDRDSLSKTIGTTLTLMLAASVVMTVVGPLVARPLLRLINTPENVIDMCAQYLIIIFAGILGIAFYNGVSGILRGMGDSLAPLAFLTFACVLNIVLDVWFVAGLGWGVAGVAWATVISQWLSSILCLRRLLRKNEAYELRLALLKPNKELSFKMAKLGLPAAATQIVFSLANILVQALTNTFGSGVMASLTIVMRVDSFAVMPMFSFGMAISTFIGQNVGANKMDRVAQGVKTGLVMILSVTLTILVLIFFFGRSLMHVFTDTGELIELSNIMLRILMPGYIAMAISQILFGVLRGAGDTVSSMWISMFTTVAVRTPLAYLLAWLTRSEAYPVGRPEVLVISLMIAWVVGAALAAIVYRAGKWRNKAITRAQNAV
ncbi:MAG: MATE family efflux transporter [Oscillospiraceae bacterium]|nr:MATE family efflux transporter [Oscillospiraceae bacterium]